MLKSEQYKNIIRLENRGQSIRSIRKLTGHSRGTIRKVLDIEVPPLFKVLLRSSMLDDYKDFLMSEFSLGTLTSQQLYEEIRKKGYEGSFSTMMNYLSKMIKENKRIFKGHSFRRNKRKEKYTTWLFKLLQGKIGFNEIEEHFAEHLDTENLQKLYRHVLEGPLRIRNRALTIFAHLNNISQISIANILGKSRKAINSYIVQFESVGVEGLFDFRIKETKKHEEPKYKENLFKILHSPPSCYGFNRTTWKMEDLYHTMAKESHSLSKDGIRMIIKKEGYKFLKAKKVLTSTDPQYREKLIEITAILSNLKSNEKFFSIDEFGPFAIKIHGGRSWTPPGDHRIAPQWQKSKGSLIITAALELSTNQVIHFYSTNKNTTEMIKLLEIILEKYKGESRIFFSWDAASWHASKKLYEKVEEVNDGNYRKIKNTPIVKLAPLPSCAQFLNVIESIFSGMARAIIHNSNYVSVEACMVAIDCYFLERNLFFKENPKRAGNNIWGKEIVKAEFSESNNCKDPRYMY